MNADGSSLLDQLQGIHTAGPPGWWPPAPGWWVLALLLLLIIAFAVRKLLGWKSVQHRRKSWIQALEAIRLEHDPVQQPHEYLAGINRLFRAVAVRAFPGTACARLQGREWVGFIASLLPEQHQADGLAVLASGPYQELPGFDAQALEASAKIWVSLYG